MNNESKWFRTRPDHSGTVNVADGKGHLLKDVPLVIARMFSDEVDLDKNRS